MSSNARTPNHDEGLSAQDTVTGKQLYLTGTASGGSFNLNVNGGGSSGGGTQYTDGATAVTHPIGTQPVFTNGSNVVTAVSTASPLPVTNSPYALSSSYIYGPTVTTTGTSSTSLIAASGSASLRTYVTAVQVSNSGATFATINLQDGSGGTTLATVPAPPGSGAIVTLPIPIRTTANTALFFQASAASTSILISAQGYTAS